MLFLKRKMMFIGNFRSPKLGKEDRYVAPGSSQVYKQTEQPMPHRFVLHPPLMAGFISMFLVTQLQLHSENTRKKQLLGPKLHLTLSGLECGLLCISICRMQELNKTDGKAEVRGVYFDASICEIHAKCIHMYTFFLYKHVENLLYT